MKTILPYKSNNSKKKQIEEMFDNISSKYDFLNHLLSFGIDKLWRKKAVYMLKKNNPKVILDVATGTADLAIQTYKIVKPKNIVGIDLSSQMIEEGKNKILKLNLNKYISLQQADAENLPFDDNIFDAITVAFGVRNFENLNAGLKEMHRVLKPNGKIIILEFSKPNSKFLKRIFFFYFNTILPYIARIFSKDKNAYHYLPDSVEHFPCGKQFLKILENVGYKSTKCTPLTLGISTIYSAVK